MVVDKNFINTNSMKLQFDANQEYQKDAINAVVDIFEGQKLENSSFEVVFNIESEQTEIIVNSTVVRGNNLQLDDEQLTKNVHDIQKGNDLLESELEGAGTTLPAVLPVILDYGHLKFGNNFTVEMETGTGKTYVYLRTVHELYAKYGFKKFIIVVPSVAIREGVWKNIQITREHFDGLYENPMLHAEVWNSKKMNQAKSFATSDNLEILVINIDSFAKSENVMRQESDYGVPLEFIQATRPIVIVDEPQNMETEIRKKALNDLNSLCILRYSATHKNYYNLVYKLDPIKAYNLGLVKKIEVDSIVSAEAYNEAYLRLIKINHKNKSTPQAHIEVDKSDAQGLQRKTIKCEAGDDLEDLVGREIYGGYTIAEIDAANKIIKFGNGESLSEGEANESLRDDILKYQIKRTVENHFEKQLKLTGEGIKVLSLFFIDTVANYREYSATGKEKGKFAQWFEAIYREVAGRPVYAGLDKYSADEVHNGYFSADKNGSWKDTKGTTKADDDTYQLIMKDKERLLDENTSLRFIFSHSTLREGWDNPNVFQICTLRDMGKEIERRQTIGRGLRLPVNSQGQRIRDENINILTVVANEGYEEFASNLQNEMEEQGVAFERAMIKKKSDARTIAARKQLILDENFKSLWNKIKHKTYYRVELDSDELVKMVCKTIEDESLTIRPPKVISVRGQLEMSDKAIRAKQGVSRAGLSSQRVEIPDILSKISKFSGITRRSVFDILDKANLITEIPKNPQQVIDELTRIIKLVLQQMQVDGIKYEKIDEEWDMKLFEHKELQGYLYSEASNQGLIEITKPGKTTHDYVAVDSEVEAKYAKALDELSDVLFYCKLPAWFKVDTPLGGYNPDWAIVVEDGKRVYFVSETKGVASMAEGSLSLDQKLKIRAGRAHFNELGLRLIGPTNTVNDTLDKLKV